MSLFHPIDLLLNVYITTHFVFYYYFSSKVTCLTPGDSWDRFQPSCHPKLDKWKKMNRWKLNERLQSCKVQRFALKIKYL